MRAALDLQESNRLATVVIRAGLILLESGAEIYRVEDTMNRLCLSFPGAELPQSYVTTTGVFFSFKTEGRIVTRVVRVQDYDTDLYKVEQVNALSRRAKTMTMEQMEQSLDRIEAGRRYPNWVIALSGGFCAIGFGLMDGAGPFELFIAFFIGVIIRSFTLAMKRTSINSILVTMIAAFLCTSLPVLLHRWIPGMNISPVVVASIALLVPGLAITNAIRDTLAGDYVSGLSRATEAFLTATAIAVGCGVAMVVPA